ncbi:MAG: hypothetical protein Q4D57_01485 [Clostridia bacterium]|nr:hypothetical protein [Clostridia bacterium]
MKKNIDLKALPSKVILPDGNSVLFDALSEDERMKIHSCIIKNIGRQISNHYPSKNEDWNNLLSVIK